MLPKVEKHAYWSNKNLDTILPLAAALGLIWSWYMYAGCGPIAEAFGYTYHDTLSFRTPSIICACLNLLATQMWRHRTFPLRMYAYSGAAFAFAGTVIILSSHSMPPSVATLTLTAICAGFAYSSILISWVASASKVPFWSLLASVFFAAALLGLSYFVLALFGNFSSVLSLLYPFLACFLLLRITPKQNALSDTGKELVTPSSKRDRVMRFEYILSLILCGGVVRVFLVESWVPPTPFDWLWGLCPLGLIFAAIPLFAQTKAAPSTMLAALGTAVCATTICALILPTGNAILSGLIFGIGWLLLAFSFAAAVDYFQSSIVSANTCIALILMSNLISSPITVLLSGNRIALPLLSIVFLGITLALTIMTRPEPSTPVQPHDYAPISEEAIFDQRCEALAAQYHLTTREYDVLTLLAKGNSLKAIAGKLFLSENTVKAHRRRIYQKMGINSRQSLIDMIDAHDKETTRHEG